MPEETNGGSQSITNYSLTFKNLQYGSLNPKNSPLTMNEFEANLAYLSDHVNYILESSQSIENRLDSADFQSLANRIAAIENGVTTTTTTVEETTTTTTTEEPTTTTTTTQFVADIFSQDLSFITPYVDGDGNSLYPYQLSLKNTYSELLDTFGTGSLYDLNQNRMVIEIYSCKTTADADTWLNSGTYSYPGYGAPIAEEDIVYSGIFSRELLSNIDGDGDGILDGDWTSFVEGTLRPLIYVNSSLDISSNLDRYVIVASTLQGNGNEGPSEHGLGGFGQIVLPKNNLLQITRLSDLLGETTTTTTTTDSSLISEIFTKSFEMGTPYINSKGQTIYPYSFSLKQSYLDIVNSFNNFTFNGTDLVIYILMSDNTSSLLNGISIGDSMNDVYSIFGSSVGGGAILSLTWGINDTLSVNAENGQDISNYFEKFAIFAATSGTGTQGQIIEFFPLSSLISNTTTTTTTVEETTTTTTTVEETTTTTTTVAPNVYFNSITQLAYIDKGGNAMNKFMINIDVPAVESEVDGTIYNGYTGPFNPTYKFVKVFVTPTDFTQDDFENIVNADIGVSQYIRLDAGTVLVEFGVSNYFGAFSTYDAVVSIVEFDYVNDSLVFVKKIGQDSTVYTIGDQVTTTTTTTEEQTTTTTTTTVEETTTTTTTTVDLSNYDLVATFAYRESELVLSSNISVGLMSSTPPSGYDGATEYYSGTVLLNTRMDTNKETGEEYYENKQYVISVSGWENDAYWLSIGATAYDGLAFQPSELWTANNSGGVLVTNYIISAPGLGTPDQENLWDLISVHIVDTTFSISIPSTTTTTTDAPTTTTVNPNYFNSITWDGVSELSKGGSTEYSYSFTFDPDLTRLESEFGIPTNSRISIVACPPGTVEPSISSDMSVIDIYGFGAPYDPTDYPQGTTVARNEYYNTYGTYEVVFKICIFDYVDGDFNYSETIGTDYPQTFNLSAAYPA